MWIYVPSKFCPCAVAQEVSNLDLNWQFQLLEQYATLNGKLSPVKSWQLACKKKLWMMRLFGRIYEPSTANHGVEKFIASLEDTHVNRFRSAGCDEDTKTLDTSGPRLLALLENHDQNGSSARMCQDTFPLDFGRSKESFARWAIELKQDSLLRLKLALRINVNGYSLWPTPNTPCDGRAMRKETVLAKGKTQNGKRQVPLESYVRFWGTPTARDWKDGACQAVNVPTNGLLGRQVVHFSPLSLTTSMDGEDILKCPRKLNPQFVEALMGWPIGWTEYDLAVTEWSLWLQRMRFALSTLVSKTINE